jgi:hypothetical protein
MRFRRQLIAFVGVVALGGTFFTAGDALAFGPQWRPAPGTGPAYGRDYGGAANLPSFRPRAVVRPVSYRPYGHIQQRPSRSIAQPRPYPQRVALAQSGPASYAQPGYAAAYQSRPQFIPAGYAPWGWAPPGAAGFVPAWQPPPFARQYAWRPAGQPWAVRPMAAAPQRRHHEVWTAPQMARFRPVGPQHLAPAGNWRPWSRPVAGVPQQFGVQGHGYRAPGIAGNQRFGFRPARPPVLAVPGAQFAGPSAAPMVGGYWRTGSAAPSRSWNPGASFRPLAYGRDPARAAKVAVRDGKASRFGTGTLPGWVTTYQETEYGGSCSWCNGS